MGVPALVRGRNRLLRTRAARQPVVGDQPVIILALCVALIAVVIAVNLLGIME